MTHENGMSRLIRKTLSYVGIFAIGLYGGYLASDVTVTSHVQDDPFRARVAFSTSDGNRVGSTLEIDSGFIAIGTEVYIRNILYAGVGMAWLDKLKARLTIQIPPVLIRDSDVSS